VRQIAENRPADAVTVSESLQSMDSWKAWGAGVHRGAGQQHAVCCEYPRYAEIVRERSVMRRLPTSQRYRRYGVCAGWP